MARGDACSKARRVITSLFGEPQTLISYVTSLGIDEEIVRQCDPGLAEVFRKLLDDYLVCSENSAAETPTTAQAFSASFSNQHDVLGNVIKTLCQSGLPGNNVLSLGYRLAFGKVNQGTVCGSTSVENYFPNTISRQLRGPAWQALLNNIGDERMAFLLLNCAIFVPLAKSCFMQIAGCPAHVRVRSSPWLVASDDDVSSMILSGSNTSCSSNAATESGSIAGTHRKSSSSDGGSVPGMSSGLVCSAPSKSNSMVSALNASLPWWISSGESSAGDTATGAPAPPSADSSQQPDSETSVYMIAPPVYGEAARRWHFHRNRMFYAVSHQEVLPPKYILYQLPASRRGAEILLRLIFDTRRPAVKELLRAKKSAKLPRHLAKLIPLFRTFLKKFKKVKLSILLKALCPLPDDVEKAISSNSGDSGAGAGLSIETLLACFTAPHQVVAFIRAVLKQSIPAQLWGSAANFEAFMSHINQFIRLHRLDTYSVYQVIHGFQSRLCTWLYPAAGAYHHPSSELSERRQRLLQTWLYWLVDNVVVTLLKTCFYVTDTTCHRYKLFFFRKSVWRCIHRQKQKALTRSQLQPLSAAEACESLRSRHALGVSMLRLVPKGGSGIRPIVNLAYKPTPGFLKHLSRDEQPPSVWSSVNAQLNSSFHILGHEQLENEQLFGATVCCMDDIYRNWRMFVQRRQANNDTRPLFFAAVDIKGCFDNINHDLLLDIMDKFLTSDGYFVRRFSAVIAGSDNLAHSRSKRCACPEDEFGSSFKSFMDGYLAQRRMHSAVLVDHVVYPRMSRERILSTLEKHVRNNFIRVGYMVCRQCTGIAQGSVLSSLLCSLYYGYLEQDLVAKVKASDGLLQRFVDDYLLVTPCRDTADGVVGKMYIGWARHGSVLNWKKTLLNFDLCLKANKPEDRVGSNELLPRVKSDFFPWCGLLFDMRTLEMSVDYSRWFGQYLSESLTIDYAGHTLQSAKRSLVMTLKTKCNAMLLDSTINRNPATVTRNVYQAFLFTALKLHAMARRFPRGHHLRQSFNLMKTLLSELISTYFQQACRQCRMPLKDGSRGRFDMSLKCVESVACCAFLHVMSRHHSAYSNEVVTFCRRRALACKEEIDPRWSVEMDLILL